MEQLMDMLGAIRINSPLVSKSIDSNTYISLASHDEPCFQSVGLTQGYLTDKKMHPSKTLP